MSSLLFASVPSRCPDRFVWFAAFSIFGLLLFPYLDIYLFICDKLVHHKDTPSLYLPLSFLWRSPRMSENQGFREEWGSLLGLSSSLPKVPSHSLEPVTLSLFMSLSWAWSFWFISWVVCRWPYKWGYRSWGLQWRSQLQAFQLRSTLSLGFCWAPFPIDWCFLVLYFLLLHFT